ncbi:Uncharacterized protein RNJ44_01086 [Nakaseomyces bracarensis]|uniref:Uncharacterized protein n=1 Tax=Nakaseomyces bracarensis TaxID=273131 RepID=A0ABR4NR05_9SACH
MDQDESLRTLYRRIKLQDSASTIDSRLSDEETSRAVVKPCVSFNTVPLPVKHTIMDEYDQDFPGVQLFPQEYTMEEYYDNESGYATDDNQNYMLHNGYITPELVDRLNRNAATRSSSPPPLDREYPSPNKSKNLSSKQQANITKMFKIARNGKIVREDYPSRPTLVNDAFIINRDLNNWHKKWIERRDTIDARREKPDETFRYPLLLFPESAQKQAVPMMGTDYKPLTKEQRKKEKIIHKKLESTNVPRVVLCHINGRRHTWVALDWAIRKLNGDTDHLIVLANVPRIRNGRNDNGYSMSRSRSRSLSRSRSRTRDVYPRKARDKENMEASAFSLGQNEQENSMMHDQFMEWSSGYPKDDIENSLSNIFEYISVILPEGRSIKVTIEIVVGHTLTTLVDAVNAYQPDLMVASTLRWERTDNLILWKSNLLIDKLATTFPVPLFVVPARRMHLFENSLQEEFQQRQDSKQKESDDNVKIPVKNGINERKMGALGPPERRLVGADSFTAGFNMKRPSLSRSVSTPITEDVFENDSEADSDANSDLSSVRSDDDLDGYSVKEKLHMKARSFRTETSRMLQDLDDNKEITHSEAQIKKVEAIIKQTIKFSIEIEELSTDDEGEDESDAPGLSKLKRVITGGTVVNPANRHAKSMLSVLDNPSTQKKKRPIKKLSNAISSDRSAASSQIKFASGVKHGDGYNALGNTHSKPVIQVHSTSDTPSPKLTPVRSHNPARGSLKPVKSNSSLRRVKSNDSSQVLRKSPSNSSSSGGFMGLFKSRSKDGASSPSGSHKKKSSLKFW